MDMHEAGLIDPPGFGSTVTKAADRSIVLARYDGVESLSMILGAGLSTKVLRAFGFYGNYLVRSIMRQTLFPSPRHLFWFFTDLFSTSWPCFTCCSSWTNPSKTRL